MATIKRAGQWLEVVKNGEVIAEFTNAKVAKKYAEENGAAVRKAQR